MPFRWDRGLREIPRWNIDQAGPCGSVMSTAEDMVKWLSFHIHGGKVGDEYLLYPADFLEMHTPQILMDYPHVKGGRSLGYGFGWRITGDMLWHSGETIGFRNVIVRWPKQRLTVVLLSNRNEPEPYATALEIGALFLPR